MVAGGRLPLVTGLNPLVVSVREVASGFQPFTVCYHDHCCHGVCASAADTLTHILVSPEGGRGGCYNVSWSVLLSRFVALHFWVYVTVTVQIDG